MKISALIIQNNILQDWIEGKIPLRNTVLRLCVSCSMEDHGSIDIVGVGWEGEVWEPPSKHLAAISALENRLYHNY